MCFCHIRVCLCAADPDPLHLLQLAIDIVKTTGRRAVLVAGWSELSAVTDDQQEQVQVPQELLILAAAPHDWLLPR